MKAAGLLESPVPHAPPPKGISSARALPQVREALHQNDPTSKAPSTQPALPRKAPPTSGKGMPAGFYRAEFLRASKDWRVWSPATNSTPPTSSHSSNSSTPTYLVHLSQPSLQEPPAPATSKHPLPQPAQQGPPNKQGRSKSSFPRDRDGNPITPSQFLQQLILRR